jgi:predicted glycoside hydrolase/deacetylase ChbG (UPF0249 family)
VTTDAAGSGWLVVNADDLGVTQGTTLGILKAHREGIVTSASIAPNMPDYRFALDHCVRQCPDLGIGLHFTLTAGRPVSDPRHVPLLVNTDGFFRWSFTSLFAAVGTRLPDLVDQIGLELEAQLDQLRSDGIEPDHVNSERHVHLIPGLFAMAASIAGEYGVPFIRAAPDMGPGLLSARDTAALALNGGFVKWGVLSALVAAARSHVDGIATADRFASYLYTGRTGSFLPALLSASPPPGVTEIMVHPALPDEDRQVSLGNRELERYVTSPDRRAELDACVAARGHTGAWQLTTFRRLADQRPA